MQEQRQANRDRDRMVEKNLWGPSSPSPSPSHSPSHRQAAAADFWDATSMTMSDQGHGQGHGHVEGFEGFDGQGQGQGQGQDFSEQGPGAGRGADEASAVCMGLMQAMVDVRYEDFGEMEAMDLASVERSPKHTREREEVVDVSLEEGY